MALENNLRFFEKLRVQPVAPNTTSGKHFAISFTLIFKDLYGAPRDRRPSEMPPSGALESHEAKAK